MAGWQNWNFNFVYILCKKINPMVAVTLYMHTNRRIYIRGGSQNWNFNFIYIWCEIQLIANVLLAWNGMIETHKDENLIWFIFSEKKYTKREHRLTITQKKAIVWFYLATQDKLTHITGKGLCTNNKISWCFMMFLLLQAKPMMKEARIVMDSVSHKVFRQVWHVYLYIWQV